MMSNIITGKMTSPDKWVDLHGSYLSKYVTGRVRNRQAAEDLVQETFIAALKSKNNFSGRSSERSWFIGILKHKIIDYFRKDSRERSTPDCDLSLWGAKNHNTDWRGLNGLCSLSEMPDSAAIEKDFYSVLIKCLAQIPENLAKAFVLREIKGLESKEVCHILDISSSNLWVRLHRARIALKAQLQVKWVST